MSDELLALIQLGHVLQRRGYHFTTGSPYTHGIVNARPQNREAIDLPGIFGWNRPFRRELVDQQLLSLMDAADILEPMEGKRWRSRIRWSSLGDQLYLHSGYPTSAADAVYFGPDTYRFVRAIDGFLNARSASGIGRAVDIGCGAGAAAIQLALSLPEADIAALDINPRALSFTRANSILAGVPHLHIAYSDLLQGVEGMFDLIVANPPYMIDKERRLYRDGGGDLGHDLSLAILDSALARLAPGGSLLLYTGSAITRSGDAFRARVARMMKRHPAFSWTYAEIDPDVYGSDLLNEGYEEVERISVVVLTVTRQSWSSAHR